MLGRTTQRVLSVLTISLFNPLFHDRILFLSSNPIIENPTIDTQFASTQNENNQASNADHLIVVAGHSVTISGHLEDAGEDEADWFLLEYQKNQGYVLPGTILCSDVLFYEQKIEILSGRGRY